MRRYILNSDMAIMSILNGSQDVVEQNTPANAAFIDSDAEASIFDYWDGDKFVPIGDPPTERSTFDYSTHSWVDLSTLEDIKSQKWTEIKLKRDRLEFGGFTFEGNIYDSDQISQGRIMGAVSAGVDQVWTLADNTTVSLTASKLQQLYVALQAHIARVHERGRIARQLIYEGETKEEVEAIQL